MTLPTTIRKRAERYAVRSGDTCYCFTTYTGWKIDRRPPPFPSITTYWAVGVDGTITHHPNKYATTPA